jgi:hypothetical protein
MKQRAHESNYPGLYNRSHIHPYTTEGREKQNVGLKQNPNLPRTMLIQAQHKTLQKNSDVSNSVKQAFQISKRSIVKERPLGEIIVNTKGRDDFYKKSTFKDIRNDSYIKSQEISLDTLTNIHFEISKHLTNDLHRDISKLQIAESGDEPSIITKEQIFNGNLSDIQASPVMGKWPVDSLCDVSPRRSILKKHQTDFKQTNDNSSDQIFRIKSEQILLRKTIRKPSEDKGFEIRVEPVSAKICLIF